jgi:hypothetical protein
MALEEFTYGREDFIKILEYLNKNIEEGNIIDLWNLVERLYNEREKIGFRRYFQRVYSVYDFSRKKDYPYDPYLIWDLLFLETLNILRRNKQGYEINRDTLLNYLGHI